MLTYKYPLPKSDHVLICLNLLGYNANFLPCIKQPYIAWLLSALILYFWAPLPSLLLWQQVSSLRFTLFLLKSFRVVFTLPRPLPGVPSCRPQFKCPLLMNAFPNYLIPYPQSFAITSACFFRLVDPVTILAIVFVYLLTFFSPL